MQKTPSKSDHKWPSYGHFVETHPTANFRKCEKRIPRNICKFDLHLRVKRYAIEKNGCNAYERYMSREFCAKISSNYLSKWRREGKNSDFWCDSWFEGHEQVVKVISFSTRDIHVRTSHTKFEVFICTAFWNISTQNVEKSPLDYNGKISLPWQRAMRTILQDVQNYNF